MIVPVTILATRQSINVSLNADFPPIPYRGLDWSAVDDDTYDASYEGEDETGSIWKCSPSGHGETEAGAILDLIEELEAI